MQLEFVASCAASERGAFFPIDEGQLLIEVVEPIGGWCVLGSRFTVGWNGHVAGVAGVNEETGSTFGNPVFVRGDFLPEYSE